MEQVINHDPQIHNHAMEYTVYPDNPVIRADVKVRINDGSFMHNCRLKVAQDTVAIITVGKFTSIAEDVVMVLGTESHQTHWISQWPLHLMPWMDTLPPKPIFAAPDGKWDITIGNDVWIGTGVKILSGVSIGDGAIVGAGAVIAKDVPPYAMCVGNPGVIKKYRFSPEDIARLLDMRWWDLPFEEIQRLAPYIFSTDIESLKRRIDIYRTLKAA